MIASIVALGPGCSGSAAPSPSAMPPAGSYHGTWIGQTSQGEHFAFVVDGERLLRLEFNVSYTAGSCSGGLGAGSFGPFASISDAKFSATQANVSGGFSWAIEGTFASATAAAGSLHVTITRTNPGPAPCQPDQIRVTWTAQRV